MKNCRRKLLVSTDLGRCPFYFDVPLKEGQLKCVFFSFFFLMGLFIHIASSQFVGTWFILGR